MTHERETHLGWSGRRLPTRAQVLDVLALPDAAGGYFTITEVWEFLDLPLYKRTTVGNRLDALVRSGDAACELRPIGRGRSLVLTYRVPGPPLGDESLRVLPMIGRLRPTEAATLTALCRVHARDGRATVRSVAAEVHRSPAVTLAHLHSLSALGLVGGLGPEGGGGTLRPLMRWVALSSSH